MNNETKAQAFKALGDPTRLHIVAFLSQSCCGRASVDEEGGVEGPTAGEVCCHITGAEKINSTISHHLHELASADLIRMERSGKRMICTLKPETLLGLADALREVAEGGTECACAPCC